MTEPAHRDLPEEENPRVVVAQLHDEMEHRSGWGEVVTVYEAGKIVDAWIYENRFHKSRRGLESSPKPVNTVT